MAGKKQQSLVLVEQIEPLILTIREHKVLLDSDLAALYGVSTKAFNQAVKRNEERFPPDFMFRLTAAEAEPMRSQIVTASGEPASIRSRIAAASKRNVRYQPYAFTEHGAIMAATILNSPRAVDVSVFVVRAFVKLRELARAHKELAVKLDELERKVAGHDEAIRSLVGAIRQLMSPSEPTPRRRIGFDVREKG
jgi:hypothetical protein